MAKGRDRTKNSGDGTLDMTPMIDIVFQLIIFFIVTLTITKEVNPEIELSMAEAAPEVDFADTTLTVEVSKRGNISIHGAQLTRAKLRSVAQRRYDIFGEYPVVIRADYRARHKAVREVMDTVSEIGLWKISFVAIKEKKT
jgi:biopolymer transport protein ExbD